MQFLLKYQNEQQNGKDMTGWKCFYAYLLSELYLERKKVITN